MKTVELNKLMHLDFNGREAYKTLRSNIQFCGSNIRIIGLTSCIPNEGKSSVSLNLAISLAEAGKKTIFVDADLRKSVLVGRYRINQSLRGLVHYLSGIIPDSELIYQSNIDYLYMIFSGPIPPNPSELLGGENFTNLIKKLGEEYDYVIIDTPPLGSVIDSAIIAKSCHGMILVIESKNISYKFAQRVKQQLEMTGCPILGTVLNKVEIKEKVYGKYYGKHYGYGYGPIEQNL